MGFELWFSAFSFAFLFFFMGLDSSSPWKIKTGWMNPPPTSIKIIKLNLTKYFLQHTRENCKGKYHYENKFCKNAWIGK